MKRKQTLIYVSPFGNNANSGKGKNQSLRLEAAVEKVLSGDYKGQDVVIQLLEGEYQIASPIVLEASKTAELGSLTFRGIGERKSICSGTVPIFPKWQPYKDGIYVARIQKGLSIDGLICSGKMQIMARYPNYQEDAVLNGFAKDAVSRERTARWSNPKGGYIRALHHAEWGTISLVSAS